MDSKPQPGDNVQIEHVQYMLRRIDEDGSMHLATASYAHVMHLSPEQAARLVVVEQGADTKFWSYPSTWKLGPVPS